MHSDAAAPPWVQVIGSAACAWRLLLSPLSSESLQQPIPRRGSQRKQKSVSPSLGTQGLFVSISGSEMGDSSDIISGLGGPHCPLPCLLHREQVLLSASSVPRGVRGSGTVDSARFGDSVDTQPHSPAWKVQDCWHQGGNLGTVSLVLSPELLTPGVITSPRAQRGCRALGWLGSPDHLWAPAQGQG